jgi:hypothetical protein
VQAAELVAVERACGPQRVQARVPERLVDVDVPESRERALATYQKLKDNQG